MAALELKIPPPAVLLLVGAGMWWIAAGSGANGAPPPQLTALVSIVAACGLAIMVAAAISFRRVRTTVNPMRPDRAAALVTGGIYRWSRNPMYLADLVLLLAWAIALSSAWSLVGLPVFVAYINRFQIAAEERMLERLFGNEFTAYKASVRRWI